METLWLMSCRVIPLKTSDTYHDSVIERCRWPEELIWWNLDVPWWRGDLFHVYIRHLSIIYVRVFICMLCSAGSVSWKMHNQTLFQMSPWAFIKYAMPCQYIVVRINKLCIMYKKGWLFTTIVINHTDCMKRISWLSFLWFLMGPHDVQAAKGDSILAVSLATDVTSTSSASATSASATSATSTTTDAFRRERVRRGMVGFGGLN